MKKTCLKKWELFLVLAAALACAGMLLVFSMHAKTQTGNVAAVYVDGKETAHISLAQDGTYTVDAALPVTLEVLDGRIRFVSSRCPDKLCEAYGFIGAENECAVCMPALTVVRIEAP